MAKTKDTTPKTSAAFAERAQRHRGKAGQLRGQVESKQAEIEAATREERDTSGLRDELHRLEREVADVEAAAAADEGEARRLGLIERASERRKDLDRLEQVRTEHDALDLPAAVAPLIDYVAKRQDIEAKLHALQGGQAHSPFRHDTAQRIIAGRIVHELSSVLRPTAFGSPLSAAEDVDPSIWARIKKVVEQDADELEAQAAQIAEGDDDQSS